MKQTSPIGEQRFDSGILNLLGWAFGILFIFSGLVDMSVHFLSGLWLFLLGLVIFPLFWKIIGAKWHFKLAWYYKVAAFVVFLILFGVFGG